MYTKINIRDQFGYQKIFRSASDAGLVPVTPEAGLIFYVPLSSNSLVAETGQELILHGNPSYTTDSGIPCASFDGESSISSIIVTSPKKITLSCFYKSMEAGVALSVGSTDSSGARAIWCQPNLIQVWYIGSEGPQKSVSVGWHHVAVTISETRESRLYIDGAFSGVATAPAWPIQNGIFMGGFSEGYKMQGYLAAVRVYNRVISDSEILILSNEF